MCVWLKLRIVVILMRRSRSCSRMVDPYVCFRDQDPDMGRIVSWVEGARAAVKDRKPVWIVPQSFDHLTGPGRYRMPTVEEQRCMCYLGLVHGAKGICWFTYTGFCVNSEELAKKRGQPFAWVLRGTIPHCFPIRYDGIKKIVSEVRELEHVWLSDTPEQTQRCVAGAEQVHTVLKRDAKHTYLFAVNTSKQPVEFSCKLADAPKSADVLWEGRQATLEDGALRDRFGPYEVHAYRWARVK